MIRDKKIAMKRRYFVFPQLPFYIIALSILEIVTVVLCVTIPNISSGQQLIICLTIFVGILSLAQIIGIVCIMWAKIGFDENGVTKYLFGKKIKFFSWESICEIKGLNNDAYWIVFCNKSVPDEKLIFNNRKSYTIPIHKRKEVVETILHYYPAVKKNAT